MADFTQMFLAKSAKAFESVFTVKQNDATNKRRHQSAASLIPEIKLFHDSACAFDALEGRVLSELTTEGLHEEQVWQQQELQFCAAKRFISENLTIDNLEQFVIANTKPRNVKKRRLESLEEMDDDVNEQEEMDEMMNGSSDEDEELKRITKAVKNNEDDGIFGTGSMDSDNDLFEGAEKEWAEEEEEDEEDQNDFDFDLPTAQNDTTQRKRQKAVSHSIKSQTKQSEVDDKFFKLAEMEQFLDQEDKKEEKKIKAEKRGAEDENASSDESEEDENEGETQNLDMFADWSDEEAGKELMYSDFFDPLAEEEGVEQEFKSSEQSSGEEEEEIENEDSDKEDADQDENEGSDEEDADQDENEGSDEENAEEDSHSDEEETNKMKVCFDKDTKFADEKEKLPISKLNKRREKLQHMVDNLQDQILAPATWQMTGEVAATNRPANGLLEEHLSLKQAAPAAQEITEEVTKSIEDLILQRIKDKAFDDCKRQVRPRDEGFQLKTERTVDQEKSKLSLAEVYEKEFISTQALPEDKTDPLHDEIKKMMDFLFPRLDALASWHYTPLQAVHGIKIRSNLPAVQMEEATPVTMSGETVLAPEEIQAKKKGEMKGTTERSKEDQHRERRKKKAAKREKTKEKEKRHKEVEKLNPGLGNKYSKERALKELEKQASGNLEIITGKKTKKSFFNELDEVTRKTKTSKPSKFSKSSSKLLL